MGYLSKGKDITLSEHEIIQTIGALGTPLYFLRVNASGTDIEWAEGSGVGYTNLTEFVGQTAWRLFYSDGSGDVKELALGADGTYLKSNGAALAPSFETISSGNVSKVGTPVDNQIAVWTGDGTIEGSSTFTYDGTSLAIGDTGTIKFGTAHLIYGNGTGQTVTFGTGAAQGKITSTGDRDFVISTGDAVTGNISLRHGANGNIEVNPNGTGSLYVSTTINLGHATDTTISRVSAGVIAVEGVNVSMAGHSHEGTAIASTGEAGGVKFLRENGDGTCSWQVPAGSGDVSKVGTPADNQIGIWTGDGTIEGDTNLTFDTTTDTLTTVDIRTSLIGVAGATPTTLNPFYVNTPDSGAFVLNGPAGVANSAAMKWFAGGVEKAAFTYSDTASTLRMYTITGDIGLYADNITGRGITIKTTTGAVEFGSTIELGHATDTTLSRSSAGVLAVEGVVVPTVSSVSTLTNKTLTSPKINENVALTATATELNVLSGIPATLTATELGYVDGVTSAIQGQINAKPTISSGAGAPGSTPTKVGDIYIDTTGDDAYIAVGTASSADWEKTNDGAGGGNVSKVGTPADNQVGVWTGDGTIEGDAALTFNTGTDVLSSGGLLLTGLTASEVVITDGSKNLVSAAVATYPSLTEFSYVKGVTSAIQTQINAKAPATAPTFATSITGSYLTASEILITDGSKNIVSAAVATYPSLTELTYLKGVTSSIQTQMNTKAATNAANSFSVGGHSITISDTTNVAGLTINQNDTTNHPTAFVINDATTAEYTATIRKTYDRFTYPVLKLFNDTSVPALSFSAHGEISFVGRDVADNEQLYSAIGSESIDPTSGAEESYLYFSTTLAGTRTSRLIVGGSVNGIGVGSAFATGVVQSRGSYDLLLQTGNATTGSITITDGANGNISLTPNGTGAVAVSTTLELGHATDTTLSRVSAGVIAVEGVTILTTATGLQLSGGTMAGNITLGENTSLDLDPAGSADGKYSGVCITGTAGAALAFGDLVYLAAADSRWELADADAATTGDRLLGICVLAAAADGNATKILLMGNIRADAAFPALTIGSPVYVGETAGDVQTAIPTGADNVIRRVGFALTADELYFNPSQDSQTTVA